MRDYNWDMSRYKRNKYYELMQSHLQDQGTGRARKKREEKKKTEEQEKREAKS